MSEPIYRPPPPTNYLIFALVATLCCCPPFGIVAIVNAAQVNARMAAGDYVGAVEASNRAKIWCWITLAAALAGWIIFFCAGGGNILESTLDNM